VCLLLRPIRLSSQLVGYLVLGDLVVSGFGVCAASRGRVSDAVVTNELSLVFNALPIVNLRLCRRVCPVNARDRRASYELLYSGTES
jgi:hypothetical protein